MLLGLAAVVGYAVWLLLYTGFSQADTLATQIDRTEARRLTEQVAAQQNVPLDGFDIVNTTLRVSNFQLTYYQAYSVSPEQEARITAFRTPGFWEVVYANEDLGKITTRIGTTGEVYNWLPDLETPPDSGRIDLADAQAYADQALTDRLNVDPYDYVLVDARTLEGDTRTSYAFQWRHRADSSSSLLRREVRVDVGPGGVEGWARIVDTPEAHQSAYRAYSDRASTYNLARTIIIFLVWVLSLTVFLMRFREYEISLRNAFLYSALFTIAYLLYMWNALPFTTGGVFDNTNWSTMRSQSMLGLAIGVFFTTLGVFQAWVSGETLLRERWPNKLNVLDGLFAGRVRFKGLGESILVGFLYTGLQLGLIAVLLFVISRVVAPWQIVSNNDQFLLGSSVVLGQLPLNALVSGFLSGAS